MKTQQKALSLALIVSIAALPGCGLGDWFGGKKSDASMPSAPVNDGSEILVTMRGKPLISKNMLDAEKKKLFENNPQLQAVAGLMGENQLNRNLVDGLASREVIREYIKENNIDQTEKFRKDFDNVLARLKDALYTQYFMEALKVEVSDAEVQKYYEENKDVMPNLLISQGGVKAKGIAFNDEAVARDFATKVKAAKNDLDKVAKEHNVIARMKDFNVVNDQSLGIDAELREKVVAIKKTPSVETFKVGKENWVVVASGKEAPKYRPLEQVQAELKQAIEKEKTMKSFEEEIARKKEQFQVAINEAAFAEKPELDTQTAEAQDDQVSAQKAVEVAKADKKAAPAPTKAA